jgi:hypothetical protein
MLKDQILKLKNENPSFGYKKIAAILGCSKSSVKFHLDPKAKIDGARRRQTNKRNTTRKIKLQHGGKCKICQYDKCLDALCFHHLDGFEKRGNVSMIISDRGFKAAQEEAKKCILICANCHAELHAKERE